MEREVGGLGAPGHPVDVGRHERERVTRVAAVLGEMEADPPHHVPQPALLPQPARESAGRRPRTLGEHAPEIAPEPFENLGGDEFGAGHRGNRFGVPAQLSRIGFGMDEGLGFQRIERRTGAGDEHPPEVTPKLQGRMEVRPGLRHPEVQDPGGRTFGKGREDPPLCRGGEFRARFAGNTDEDPPARRPFRDEDARLRFRARGWFHRAERVFASAGSGVSGLGVSRSGVSGSGTSRPRLAEHPGGRRYGSPGAGS